MAVRERAGENVFLTNIEAPRMIFTLQISSFNFFFVCLFLLLEGKEEKRTRHRLRSSSSQEEFLTGRKYAYGQLKEAAARVASALYRKGYRKGDVLLVFSTNNVDYIVLMVACAAAGVWFSTASPAFIAGESPISWLQLFIFGLLLSSVKFY